jgi:hypothetical protein
MKCSGPTPTSTYSLAHCQSSQHQLHQQTHRRESRTPTAQLEHRRLSPLALGREIRTCARHRPFSCFGRNIFFTVFVRKREKEKVFSVGFFFFLFFNWIRCIRHPPGGEGRSVESNTPMAPDMGGAAGRGVLGVIKCQTTRRNVP